ncbi:TP53-target gene 5 protein [Tupaia chinensis]|uniref:TP53-target gene 5 protein n=1 Tax=Tupaia chinensis TaxID=246437 RepID=UPI0003C90FCB|nr:TP53-target gene 5 protein [Tupaia chinensis]
MSPSVKKRPKNRVVSKMQDDDPQDKTNQPVSKIIKRTRLKTVLKNLSLLKLLKSSNRRIHELHSLARRCWRSLLRVPKMLCSSSGDNVSSKVKQNSKVLQEAKCPKNNLESQKAEFTGEPKETKPKEWSKVRNKAKRSPEGVPSEQQAEPEVPKTSRGHDLNTGARGRQPPTEGPRVIFLKTNNQKTPMGDMKQLDVADQWIWFEGLPTRIHLPGPRVMCRSSALRWVKRCCTRFCSASLEMPMGYAYKVV